MMPHPDTRNFHFDCAVGQQPTHRCLCQQDSSQDFRDEKGTVNGKITLSSYRQVYDFIDAKKDLAFKQFKVLDGETND